MRTGDEIRTEALLAAMDAADAEAVILPASAVPDEERPLLPPFLTSAHSSISPLCFLEGQQSFNFGLLLFSLLNVGEDFLILGIHAKLLSFNRRVFRRRRNAAASRKS